MNIDARLRELEFRYLVASSGARAAKSIHHASVRDAKPMPPSARPTKSLWHQLVAQKRAIAALMGTLEDADTAR
jgi:hypothetical protein